MGSCSSPFEPTLALLSARRVLTCSKSLAKFRTCDSIHSLFFLFFFSFLFSFFTIEKLDQSRLIFFHWTRSIYLENHSGSFHNSQAVGVLLTTTHTYAYVVFMKQIGMSHRLLNITFVFLIIQCAGLATTQVETGNGLLSLPEGRVQGIQTRTHGVYRYTIPYAQPPVGSLRWQDPQPVLNRTGIYRGTELPPPCPQGQPGGAYFTNEDCLYLSAYVPQRLLKLSRTGAPIFFWVHGGSMITGSASGYGLDGSTLADKSGNVVIVAQYRLGLLGFLRTPRSEGGNALSGNYAIKDLMMALNYLKKNANYFGGDKHRITIAGQSSGASLIKTLLTVKSATNLFSRAILHSAPLNYGDHTISTAETVGSAALSTLNCTIAELRSRPTLPDILAAQHKLQEEFSSRISPVASAEPFKPVVDGSLVSVEFIHGINQPSRMNGHQRSIIFTTVKDEAGPTIGGIFKPNTSQLVFEPALELAVASTDTRRLGFIKSSKIYSDELKDLISHNVSDATRDELSVFGTDYIWRCANQQSALNLTINRKNVLNVGDIWIGEFHSGIKYNSTISIDYCQSKVCHEDDILSVFGLPIDQEPHDDLSQHLVDEIQARWAAFAANGDPNLPGYRRWLHVQGPTQLNLLQIRTSNTTHLVQQLRPRACERLWGVKARFDAQIYS